MPHDKIRAAARERMAKTGEPYTAARRAVVSEQQAGTGGPSPGAGYALRMSGEIHDWLADLRGSDQSVALRVVRALVTLMTEGAGLGDPLVISAADSWPWALGVALDRSYRQSMDRLAALRRGEADAATLVRDIQDHVAELEALQAAGKLADIQQQAAEARRLLPRMVKARNRLRERTQQLQARVEAARARKETLKAGYVAVRGSIKARQAMAALDLAEDDGDRQPEDSGAAISAEEVTLADVTAQMERELGVEALPEGLTELWPGAPWHGDIRILFAVEPPGTALLIAVLEGPGVVQDQYPEAVMASADVLRRVRAGQAPEAGAHAYNDTRSFLQEFYPGTADTGADSPAQ